MKKIYSLILALVSTFVVQAQIPQAYSYIEFNEFTFPLTSTGDLFQTADPSFARLTYGDDDISLIYGGNLWIKGTSPDNQIKLAAEMFSESLGDYMPGPIALNASQDEIDIIRESYNRVFTADREQVDTHVAYFEAVQNGNVEEVFPNGYTTPQNFLEWPAMGDFTLGVAPFLAPFFDYDGDGVYAPENGDHPEFCGDKCAYVIFNDLTLHNSTQAQPLGIEVHLMVFSYESSGNNDLENTIFMNYTFFNRGTQALKNGYVGIWNDFDVGNHNDDRLMTNVKRGAIVAYNGDAFDDNVMGLQGFGTDLAAVGMMVLSGPSLDADLSDNEPLDEFHFGETQSYGPQGFGFGDGTFDNETHGLSHSIAMTSSPVTQDGPPSNAVHYANYLEARFLDGSNQIFLTDPEEAISRYHAPKNTDPLDAATSTGLEIEWNEEDTLFLQRDVQALGSMGPFAIQPGQQFGVSLAYVFVRDSQDEEATVLEAMDERLKNIRLIYNETDGNCFADNVLSTHEITAELPMLTVFPNPASEFIRLPRNVEADHFAIYNAFGSQVISGNRINATSTINIETLSAGVYTLVLNHKSQTSSTKFIVK
jgi:hypothetical protein